MAGRHTRSPRSAGPTWSSCSIGRSSEPASACSTGRPERAPASAPRTGEAMKALVDRRHRAGAHRIRGRRAGRMGLARAPRGIRQAPPLADHEARRRPAGVVHRVLLRRPGARGRGLSGGCSRPPWTTPARVVPDSLEAYPVDSDERSHPDSMFFGAKSMYDRAGFEEVARRKPTRPVVRKPIRPRRTTPSG